MINDIPLISVIVPIYKVEKYLHKCIDSILSQTYYNLEIILVNDGSPDSCGIICDEYGNKDKRIKVIHKVNGGLSDARNVAIDLAVGEYITFIDSDDYVSCDYVETLYRLIKKYDCKVAVALPIFFDEGKQIIASNESVYDMSFSSMEAIEEMFYQERFDTTAWGKLYHYSLFKTGIRYPKGILFEDLPTTYLLFAATEKVAFTNKQVYYYLLRNNSIEGSKISSFKINSALQVFSLMEEHSDLLCKVRKSYECRMLSFSFHILLKMSKDSEHYETLLNKIKQYRWHVICDCKARKKTRIASLISYLGINNVKIIFNLIDKRK